MTASSSSNSKTGLQWIDEARDSTTVDASEISVEKNIARQVLTHSIYHLGFSSAVFF